MALEDGRFYVKYYDDHRMPASPRSIPLIFFRRPIGTMPSDQETEGMPHDLVEVLRELTQLPPHESTDPQLQAGASASDWATLMPRLRAILSTEEVRPVVERALRSDQWRRGRPAQLRRPARIP